MNVCLHVKYASFLSYFNENLIFSSDFRKKYSNIKFHKSPSSGGRSDPSGWTDTVTDGSTDRHDEANSRFSQFCERA